MKRAIGIMLAVTTSLSLIAFSPANKVKADAQQTVWNFEYTGSAQTWTVPYTGEYDIQTWGACGGDTSAFKQPQGYGGYASGNIMLQKGQVLYIYVGGTPKVENIAAYNGGSRVLGYNYGNGGGGGATDVRYKADDLYSRVIVAGGGGGTYTNWEYWANGEESGTRPTFYESEFGGYGEILGIDKSLQNTMIWNMAGTYNNTDEHEIIDPRFSTDQATDRSGYSFGKGEDGYNGGGGGWYGGASYMNWGGDGGSSYILTATSYKPAGYNPDTKYYFASVNSANFYDYNRSGDGKATITLAKKVDTTPPTGSYTLSKTTWTCENVTINVTATDDDSGVASIKTPDGNTVSAATASYTATDNGTYTFVVTDNAGNTAAIPITVSNIDRMVTVTHSLTASYTIDPNTETFSAQDIQIKNNSQHIGVSVAMQGLTSNGIANVTPDKYPDWRQLTREQTEGSIALGIGVRETSAEKGGWKSISALTPIYTSGALGVLDVQGHGSLMLNAKYGLAWSRLTTVSHNLTLLFTACDAD